MMIILEAADANRIRGLVFDGHALAPRPLVTGQYALSDAVLTDPVYMRNQALITFLASLPQVPNDRIKNGTSEYSGGPVTGSDWSQDPALLARTTYQSTWVRGQTVVVD